MPEGHTIHRLARDHRMWFAGRRVVVTSPQGRFDAAPGLDGSRLEDTEAFGKHLLYRFSRGRWIHIHLGLFGRLTTSATPKAPPRDTVRLRLANRDWYADLVGPTRCALIDAADRAELLARLGPDPLRAESRPSAAWARISHSDQPIAALLMDQRVLAGVGNVYRAELLYRSGLDPHLPGRELREEQWLELWEDLRRLMRAGVRANRIVTTRRNDRERVTGRVRSEDATYVYGRADEPCRVCGTLVRVTDLMDRRLYWCPTCQN